MNLLTKLKRAGMEHVGPRVAQRQPTRVDLPLTQFGLERSADGSVVSNGVSIPGLTQTYGSPLHVVRGDAVLANAQAAMQPSQAGAGADVFYSYKTNPVPGVLERIHQGGVGAEVISAYEFWLARKLGVPGERIIYNGPAKSPESIAEAIRVDTLLINANSTLDLALIEAQAIAVGKPANVGVRVALPGMWAGQFGMDSASSAVLEMIKHAEKSPHLHLRALHFHRGITMRYLEEVQSHVTNVLRYVDYLWEQTQWHPEMLDIGGSLACPTTRSISTKEFRLNRALGTDLVPPDPAQCVTVAQMATISHNQAHEHFSTRDQPTPQMVLEPGRALIADTHFLLTTVLDVKDDSDVTHVIVDGGTNIAESVSHEYHQLFNLSAMDQPATSSYRIAGPICTPADVIYNNWRMPDPTVGDVLAIMDTGAYCIPFSTSFSFPRPAIALLEGATASLLRRSETFDDLVARDTIRSPGDHS